MKIYLLEHRNLYLIIELFIVCGVSCEIMLAMYLKKIIREAENISVTNNQQLKQFRLKYMQYMELHEGKPNSSAYTDKFISRLMFRKMSVYHVQFISKQFIQLSTFLSGVFICKDIVLGLNLIHYFSFYVIAFFNLYFYFSVCYFVDVKGKKEMLRIELIDYLENHMQYRLEETKESIKELDKKESIPNRRETNVTISFFENKQKEWEELESLVEELIM